MVTRMGRDLEITMVESIESLILTVRGQRVMLDSDLARIYGVTTHRLNEQFKRNKARFPEDFAFRLTPEEYEGLRSQIAISNSRGGRRYMPWVFTEHGALMLATVLNSPIAVAASVRVIRAFVRMREMLSLHRELAQKLFQLENRLDDHDQDIQKLFAAIRHLIEPPADVTPPGQIGFHIREQPGRYHIRRGRKNK